MPSSRRSFIATAACSAVVGMAGCVYGTPFGNDGPRVTSVSTVTSDEPLIENVDIGPSAGSPDHYSALLASPDDRDQIRWEYIREEIPVFVDDLNRADLGSEYMIFFGMFLPQGRSIDSRGHSMSDGTLVSKYHLTGTVDSREPRLNTHITIVRSDDAPDDVSFEVRY